MQTALDIVFMLALEDMSSLDFFIKEKVNCANKFYTRMQAVSR